MNHVSTVFFVFLAGPPIALSLAPTFTRRITNTHSELVEFPESFGRAVECVETYGLCGINELEQLADGEK